MHVQCRLAAHLILLLALILVTTNLKTYIRSQFCAISPASVQKCGSMWRLKARCTAPTSLWCGAEQGSVTTEITLIELVTAQKGVTGVKVCRGSRRSRQVSRPVWHRPKGHGGIDSTATGKFGLDCDQGLTPLTCLDQWVRKVSKSKATQNLHLTTAWLYLLKNIREVCFSWTF